MGNVSSHVLKNVMEVIVSVFYPFTNPIGVVTVLQLLEKGILMLNIYRAFILHGKCSLCYLFQFLSCVQVDTIKLHYFRNLYFPLNLFGVRGGAIA